MNNEFAKPFFQLPPERYHFVPFGSFTDYLKFLPALDIGIAPLVPSEYNRCRSDVKFIEYAAHGVVGIYSDLEPYRDTVVHGKTGFLYKTPQDLIRRLDALASDAGLRQRVRQEAYDYVVENRRMADHIQERLALYRSLLPGPTAGDRPELSGEVLAAAERDGNYFQLRPQAPERALLDALQTPVTPERVQALSQLAAQHPKYLVALQQLGRMLNDLRNCRGALSYLEQALALNPKSARTLCEIGRARFGLNDFQGARRDIEAALEVNPLFYPGWQYMLRLLALARSPDGPRWAKRAYQLHPYCYTLALAGAVLYPGLEAIREIQRLLDHYAPTFTPEERPAAAATFSRAILEAGAPVFPAPAVLDLLQRCCEVFPQSARFADLLGRALYVAGRHDESKRQHARALELRKIAALYQAEYPKEDGTFHYWQFADHIRRWT
jgi:tetratricopeptide (TPR) repeat protein